MLPEAAVIVEVPALKPVASPALLMLATASVPELHVTLVSGEELPSLK